MFKTTVSQTSFTRSAANSMFDGKINGENYHGDYSFISTLRALVYTRMEKDDYINLYFSDCQYSAYTIESNSKRRVMEAIYTGHEWRNGDILIKSIESADANEKCFELIEAAFHQVNEGYERITKVTDFFRKSFKVLCYVNATDKKVAIFVEKLNTRRMHYLQCAIFAFLPWYFKPEDGVTRDEMDLIQSLRETSGNKYIDAIEKIAEKYDFRSIFIRSELSGFESAFEEQRKEILAQNISEYLDNIENLKRRLESVLIDKRNAENELFGIEMKLSSDDQESEIMDYFLCNKKLYLQRVNHDSLEFVVKDYLTYFDEEMAKVVINNKRSYVYEESRGRISNEDIEMLMNEIFIEQNLRIRMCCAYKIILGRRATGIAAYCYGSDFSDCTPNPHIDRYNCLGDYERVMNERLAKNDIVGVIEQCVASCKSLNFADGAVLSVFMRTLYGGNDRVNNKCIELPNGDVVTAKDAIKWLKEHKEYE